MSSGIVKPVFVVFQLQKYKSAMLPFVSEIKHLVSNPTITGLEQVYVIIDTGLICRALTIAFNIFFFH